MDRCLEVSKKIVLSSYGNNTEFTIERIVGVGGSCIAYEVSYLEGEGVLRVGILKEFCPAYLCKACGFERNEGSIVIPPEYEGQFRKGLLAFNNTYKNINNYISKNISAANYHPVQIGLFQGNNTSYILSSLDYGDSYDKINESSLQSILEIALSTAKAVRLYHKAGYLHLDIKSKNILVLDGVKDIVKLFDFDSLTSINDIKCNRVFYIPVPEDYYVPELINADLRNIGIQTDILEIGALIFSKIYERAPGPLDMEYDVCYDMSVPLLRAISPKAKFELVKLFKSTIQISKRRRYKNDELLIEQIEKVLSLVSGREPYLLNLPLWQPSSKCIDRPDDLVEIENRLKDGFVFIKAMGGIGKSELAKIFAKKNQSRFHTIQFCKFSSSLKNTIASIPVWGINDNEYSNIDDLVTDKLKVLHTCDSGTLLIIDNFNVTHDDLLRDFLPSNSNGFKVIFTTRCKPASEYYASNVYELGCLSIEDAKRLFYMHCGATNTIEEDIVLENLCEIIECNTLVLVLLFKVIKNSNLSILDIYQILTKQEIHEISTEVFHEYDISSAESKAYNKIAAHMSALFDISNLNDSEIILLKNMTLVPSMGIEIDELIDNCNCSALSKSIVYGLIDKSWVEVKNHNCISLHSIVSDILASKIKVCDDSYYRLAEYIEGFYNVNETCHISVLLKGLAYALQLDKRYKIESIDVQLSHKYAMADLYMALYRPNEVKECFDDIFFMLKDYCGEKTMFLAYVYSLVGEYESKYGTFDASNESYSRALEYYYEADIEDEEFVLDIHCCIAQNFRDNNEVDLSYQKYLEAFDMAKECRNIMFLRFISETLYELSKELGDIDREKFFRGLCNKFNQDLNEDDIIEEIRDYVNNGEVEQTLLVYEQFLLDLREELGEDSPLYKYAVGSRVVFYFVNGRKDEAFRMMSEHLNYLENTFGQNSMELASQLVFLAPLVIECYEFEYATDMVNRAMNICEINNQLNSYVYTKAKMDLLIVYANLGNKDKAYELVEEINFEKFSGEEVLSDVIRSIGIVLCDISKYDRVETLCEKLLKNVNTGKYDKFLAYILLSISAEHRGLLEQAYDYVVCAGEEVDVKKVFKFNCTWFVTYKRALARLKMKQGDNYGALVETQEIINAFDDKLSRILYVVYTEQILYYVNLDKYEEAIECINKGERILKDNNYDGGAYTILYNNASYCYIKLNDFKKAKLYLDKVLELCPNIKSAESSDAFVICGNVGWTEFNLGNIKKAETYLKLAVDGFEKLGLINSSEYYISKYNLALLYTSLCRFVDAYEICILLYGKENNAYSLNGQNVKAYIRLAIVQGLLSTDEVVKALAFTKEEDKKYINLYGEFSIERIDLLQNFFSAFRLFGYVECWDFYEEAQIVFDIKDYNNTIYFARQLNFSGLLEIDEKDNPFRAELLFEQSRTLFEKLKATDDEYFDVVVQNIEYAENEIIKRLFG